MLCTDMMPSPTNAPLEQRERVLYGVRVGISHNVDTLTVIDSLVLSRWHPRSFDGRRIRRVIIGKDYFGILTDVLADILGERLSLRVIGVKHSKFAVALANSNDDFFVFQATMPPASTISAADVSLIHFN